MLCGSNGAGIEGCLDDALSKMSTVNVKWCA